MGLTRVMRRLDSLRYIVHRVSKITETHDDPESERLDNMNRVKSVRVTRCLPHLLSIPATRGYSEQSNSNQGT